MLFSSNYALILSDLNEKCGELAIKLYSFGVLLAYNSNGLVEG